MKMVQSIVYNQTIIRFPTFHYSTIPLFHLEPKVNITPLG